MSERKKAHIFAHNHRPVEDPQGEVLLVHDRGDTIEITARSKPHERYLIGTQKKVMQVGPTAHIMLDREQALDLSKQLREWAEQK